MRSLYLRIYLTVVVVLALFAAGSTWLFQREVQAERGRFDAQVGERVAAWADLIQRSLPAADSDREQQAAALRDWSQRLRLPLALDDEQGQRIAASESYLRRTAEAPGAPRGMPVRLDDGRTLWLLRGGPMQGMRGGGPLRTGGDGGGSWMRGWLPPWLHGAGLAALLVLLFVAVAAGAWPVVRGLTRRLESLKRSVERFGEGALGQRVVPEGHDEVAALGASFNQAAERIEALVRSHQSLLANASHELRSPLARLKMAVSLLEDLPAGAAPETRGRLKSEIRTNITELDALVEEVLLASRLDAQAGEAHEATVELIAIAAEEAARVGAELQATLPTLAVRGDERLLRRALRNLLENARRYGEGGEITLSAARSSGRPACAELRVCDRGPGVPEALRERIFEPFFRLPGHAEREGGVGLGLALVKQIAERHRGSVRCQARDPEQGGGSCFVLSLPLA